MTGLEFLMRLAEAWPLAIVLITMVLSCVLWKYLSNGDWQELQHARRDADIAEQKYRKAKAESQVARLRSAPEPANRSGYDSKNGEMSRVSAREVYSALVQLTTHAESITWNRFYNFLMGNSILILAWATIFAPSKRPPAAAVVLVGICVVGAVSGVLWAALGERGRRFLDRYLGLAARIERDTFWPGELGIIRPFVETIEVRDTARFRWAGSRTILIGGPLLFTLLYGVLFVASFVG